MKYQHAVLSYSIVGATSLFTTVLDESKWLNNYVTGTVGGKELIEKMYQTGVLNDGRKLDYAFAIAFDEYKGWKRIGHGGADAGFRTYACRFPEKNLGIVVFSNLGSVSPVDLTNAVANILIPDSKTKAVTTSPSLTYTDSITLKKFQGSYYSNKGQTLRIVWLNGKLRVAIPAASSRLDEWRLAIGPNNRFTAEGQNQTLILNEKNKSADSVLEFNMEGRNDVHEFKRQPQVPQKISNEFAGRYYNAETEAFYTVTEKEGKLTMEHRKYNNAPMRSIGPDQFTLFYWWMSHIRFIRNKKGKIVAFEVNAGRILHLRYDKVK
jgi:hypothetical protein